MKPFKIRLLGRSDLHGFAFGLAFLLASVAAPAAQAQVTRAQAVAEFETLYRAFAQMCMVERPSRSTVRRGARALGIRSFSFRPIFTNNNSVGTYYGYSIDIHEGLVGYHNPDQGQYAAVYTPPAQHVDERCAVVTGVAGVGRHQETIMNLFQRSVEAVYGDRAAVVIRGPEILVLQIRGGAETFGLRIELRACSPQLVSYPAATKKL